MPITVVGNDFVVSNRQKRAAAQILAPEQVYMPVAAAKATAANSVHISAVPTSYANPVTSYPFWQRAHDTLHAHSVVAFALLLLLVGSTGISVFGNYRAASITEQAKPILQQPIKAPIIAGLNATVPTEQIDAKVQQITSQSITLTVGDHTAPVRPETIQSWLKITPSNDRQSTGIHVSSAVITTSITDLAKKYEKTPINEVTSVSSGTSTVISTGKNGSKLTDPAGLQTQAIIIAKTLMDAKGFAFTTPLETVAFQSLTPAAFAKLIEVDIVTKQMYLYDNGQLYKSYPISAGAPETPTPIGQFKTFSKLRTQNMNGFNPNGSKYFQPNVKWISYFQAGGFAIHGNYWRPASWFGNINSSHGCVSLPEAQAKEVFDWSPVGTTVITHR